MTYHYCTLFDSFFLSRGLTLYDSLKKTTPDFILYVFPFDQESEQVLRQLHLDQMVVVAQRDFETPGLLKVKAERGRGEYCWTCTPAIIDYCIRTFQIPHCTYLDADLFFFGNANALVDEMGSASVLITDHRYSPRYDQSRTSGKYCVQFMTFKSDPDGLEALNWWKDRCLEWCFDRIEDGKFGDQKYLDDWLVRFRGIFELPNEGAGLAPWNIQQYRVLDREGTLFVKSILTAVESPVVFYHFHAVKFLPENKLDLSAYRLSPEVIELFYKSYFTQVNKWNRELFEHFQIRYPVQEYRSKKRLPVTIHKILRKVLRVYNVFDNKELVQDGALY